MKMYKVIGHNRRTADVIGYYKEKTKADKVSRNLISTYRDGIQIDTIEVDVERIPMYVPEYDITFVMNNIRYKGECIIEECIGWYHGVPDEASTNKVEDYGLVAEYF